jgi:hypothetical protein
MNAVNWAFQNFSKVHVGARLVLISIAVLGQPESDFFVSREQISASTGLSKRQVARLLLTLLSCGLVARDAREAGRRGYWGHPGYRLTFYEKPEQGPRSESRNSASEGFDAPAC